MNQNQQLQSPDPQQQMMQMQQQMAQQMQQMQQMQMAQHVQSQTQMERPKTNNLSRTTAIVLALFLGGLGAHKFYLGQAGMGILYLLFFWTFIPACVAFIEVIMLLVQSDKSFDNRFNYG
jgi:TM2 domain-containing membrane protein YozV